MNNAAFMALLEEIRQKLLLAKSFTLAGEKAVNYGWQFTLLHNLDKIYLIIYNGKKGLSFVWNGKSEWTSLLQSLLALDANEPKLKKQFSKTQADRETVPALAEAANLSLWAGSDESGKGDFFGPLVVAAVALDRSSAQKLQLCGVRDCKTLSDEKILALENVICKTALDYTVLELPPRLYNLRYTQIKAQGGGLNELLASGHYRALEQLLQRQPCCTFVLIDRFMTSEVLLEKLRKSFQRVQFQQKARAESNMAVAAASVLARARFLRAIKVLSAEAGCQLPKGSVPQTTACAQEIQMRLGKEALNNFVKLHFANMKKLCCP